MALNVFGVDEDEARTHVLVTIASEVFLVCAVVLVFFVHFQLPMTIASAASLAGLFIGSLLAWQKYRNALAILLLSLVAVQVVLLKFSEILIFPFVLADIIILVIALGSWKPAEPAD